MGNLIINRTPDIIAAEINSIKEQTRKVVLYNSVEIGRKLTEAKELVAHGEWGTWLENAVDYSKSTANNLMKIFEEFGADQITLLDNNLKSQAFGNLSYSQAVLLLGVPAEERESFVESNNVEDMSTRELKKAIEELKKSEEEKEAALKAKDEAMQKLSEIEGCNDALEEAFNEGAAERKELSEKVEKLEEKLKEALNREPEITVDVDSVEVDKELQETIEKLKAEKEAALIRLKAMENRQAELSIRFKVYFEDAGKSYQRLIEELANIKAQDEVEYVRLRAATEKFLGAMLQRVSN